MQRLFYEEIMKRLKTILFDLDGTLLDTLDDLRTAVNTALSKYNFPLRTREEIQSFVGNGIGLLVSRSVPENTSQEIIEDCFSIFKEYYGNHLMDYTHPYSGICEVLRELKDSGYIIAVVSNKIDPAAKNVCNHFFGNLVDVVVGESEQIRRKPYPDAVEYALDALNTSKQDTVLFGDSSVDLQTAQNSNVPFIGVTWGFRSKEQLIESGAKQLIDSPDEIIETIHKYEKGLD